MQSGCGDELSLPSVGLLPKRFLYVPFSGSSIVLRRRNIYRRLIPGTQNKPQAINTDAMSSFKPKGLYTPTESENETNFGM